MQSRIANDHLELCIQTYRFEKRMWNFLHGYSSFHFKDNRLLNDPLQNTHRNDKINVNRFRVSIARLLPVPQHRRAYPFPYHHSQPVPYIYHSWFRSVWHNELECFHFCRSPLLYPKAG